MMMMEHDDYVQLMEDCGCKLAESDGIEMFLANVAKIQEYAAEIMQLAHGLEDLEDWMEHKMSVCSQSMSDVKHYMEYRRSAYAQQSGMVPGTMPMPNMDMIPLGAKQDSEGDRMPVMTQHPSMTPPSAAPGSDDMESDSEVKLATVFSTQDVPLEPAPMEGDEEMLYGSDEEDELMENDLDPVGDEDEDIDNDGDVDSSDDYLMNRRKKISQNMQEESLSFLLSV